MDMQKKRAQGESDIRTQIHEGWEEVEPILELARDRGEQLLEDLADEIRKHPLRSAAAAFGIGFIVAKLLGRGRHS
jgi:hypothetical protein